MKSFFEEYGFVMLSAIVVIALIGIAGSLKNTVESGIKSVMVGFEHHIVEDGNLKDIG